MYDIDYREQALLDIARLKKSEPKAYQKVLAFIDECNAQRKNIFR
jgi:hypothetical protein